MKKTNKSIAKSAFNWPYIFLFINMVGQKWHQGFQASDEECYRCMKRYMNQPIKPVIKTC